MKRLLFWLGCWVAAAGAAGAAPGSELVYIGTESRGIYALRLDPGDGTLSAPALAADALNPGFLALAPDRHTLYAADDIIPDPPASEVERLVPKPLDRVHLPSAIGGVTAYRLDPASGGLTYLNQQPSGDGTPPHLVVDATGRMLIVADYGAGTVCAWPIAGGGRLGPRSLLIADRGPPGPNRERQSRPHPHSATLSPDNRFVLVCDLGLDRVFVYRLDPSRASLALNDPPFAAVPAGAGPRHSKFSSDGRFFYVVNELGGSICVFAWDGARGVLELRQTLSTLPAGFHGDNLSAEIRIHPNGRFVYASNRRADSLALFARDANDGLLRFIETVPSGGRNPRNFALSPDGRWLLSANSVTNNIAVFRVDPRSGRLTPTGHQATVGRPICVLFYD